VDYLLVTSTPAQEVTTTGRLVCQIEAASKRDGGVSSLASKPDGLTLSASGKLE